MFVCLSVVFVCSSLSIGSSRPNPEKLVVGGTEVVSDPKVCWDESGEIPGPFSNPFLVSDTSELSVAETVSVLVERLGSPAIVSRISVEEFAWFWAEFADFLSELGPVPDEPGATGRIGRPGPGNTSPKQFNKPSGVIRRIQDGKEDSDKGGGCGDRGWRREIAALE